MASLVPLRDAPDAPRARIEHAPGEPLVVVCNGFPGRPQNEDLAVALRDAGVGVMLLLYRGRGPSPGTFSYFGALDDARAAVAYARRLSPRVGVLGHSFGGLAALTAALHEPVERLALLAPLIRPADLLQNVPLPERTREWRHAEWLLEGRAGDWQEEFDRLAKAVRPGDLASAATRSRLLLVHGERDATLRVTVSRDFVEEVQARGGRPEAWFPDDDHYLTKERSALLRRLVEFFSKG